jgi:hypothetical protein
MAQPLIQPVMPLMSIPAQPVRPPQQPAGQPSQIMRSGFGKHIPSRILFILDFILTHVLNFYYLIFIDSMGMDPRYQGANVPSRQTQVII